MPLVAGRLVRALIVLVVLVVVVVVVVVVVGLSLGLVVILTPLLFVVVGLIPPLPVGTPPGPRHQPVARAPGGCRR